MHPGGMSWAYGMPWIGIILGLIAWAGILVVTILAIRWLFITSGAGKPPEADSALEIVKKRYARGEISKEEFEQIRKDLEGL